MARRGRWIGACSLCLLLVVCPPDLEGADKTFVYGLEGEPQTLDSAKDANVRTQRVAWILCEALLNTSSDGRVLEPGLAESWTASPDGRVVTVKLRPGVVFHDGTPVDATAVKSSFEREFRSKHPLYTSSPRNARENTLSGLIDDITVDTPLSLTFKLKHPAVHYLSDVDIVSPIALSKLGKDFGRNPACTGPFKLDRWTADEIVLRANDRYWGGRPRLDRVVFRFITDGKDAAESLIRGEIDFVPAVTDAALLERLRERPDIALVPVAGLNINYLGFNTQRPPFNKPELRRAVIQAINVPRLSSFLGRGMAVAASGPLPPAMKAHDPSAAQPSYDLAKATELLQRAVAAFPGKPNLVYSQSHALMAEVAAAIQNDLRRAGTDIQLDGKPTFQDVVAAARAQKADMFLYSWYVRGPYPDRLLMPLFHSKAAGTSNLTRYSNPAVDRLLEEASQLPDGSEQHRLYAQIQKTIVDDGPMVFLYHFTRVAAHSKRIKNLSLKLDVAPHDKLLKVDLAP